ncbi:MULTISPECIES: type II toxin-antitoxin system RelE/ParE family toxin [Flavobacterium]|uniref:Type II toxin-antitoxin system RelE/ParE family toxin n=1 Tax=Flavobacterium rhamnosiphilum TaxID=2541724 RepID=A0A4V2Z904_9FLAO|nr:type II toxin-antitoxin system RelE/ParE family toxin [Flavobacterium rhamnosiphilum]TDE42320.1 type II toxin-antitoxin system RelE/ParE family toxin [Flavobacterium rhamnosiphilum]
MKYKIVIVEEAKLDFKTTLDWYKSIQPKLGERFTKSFRESLKIIKLNPLLFQIRYDNTRVALIENFPYLIHFNSYNNKIVIKAIFHTSRNTEIWIERN